MENGVLTTYINEERTISILGNGKEEKTSGCVVVIAP